MRRLNISEEQAVANRYLMMLETIDPTCIVAGGAPRDWYLGSNCNDIDIFIYFRPDLTTPRVEKAISYALGGVKLKTVGETRSDSVYNNPNIRKVYSHLDECSGKEIQIILTHVPTYEIVKTFPYSICKFWYKGGEVRPQDILCKKLTDGKLIIEESVNLYANKDEYVGKIRKKFTKLGYTFCKPLEVKNDA